MHLTAPVSDPDPALCTEDPAGLEKARDQPRTAEIFEGVRPGSDEFTTRRIGWGKRLLSRLKGGRGRARSTGSRAARETIPAPHRTGEIRRIDAGSDDGENGSDSNGIWLPILLLSYSSAVTFGLAWVLFTGRTIHRLAEPAPAESPRAADLHAGKASDAAARVALPPIPIENVALVGQTVRIGDLEITPLSVTLAPVELVRTIEPVEYRVEEMNSLVLRLKLTNLSNTDSLKPLAHLSDQRCGLATGPVIRRAARWWQDRSLSARRRERMADRRPGVFHSGTPGKRGDLGRQRTRARGTPAR